MFKPIARLWHRTKSAVDSLYAPFEQSGKLREAYLVAMVWGYVVADALRHSFMPISILLRTILWVGLVGISGYFFRSKD